MKAEAVQKVLVIGAGAMGEGIAQIFAQAAIEVVLVDVNAQALDRCQNQIKANLLLLKEYGLLTVDPDTISARIQSVQVADMAQIADHLTGIDFVVEAIPEILELKRSLFASLDKAPEHIILSSNTSSLTISEIAQGLKNPARVVGLHFFFPAHIIPLVEIHSSPQTPAETITTTRDLMKRVGKVPVVVRKEIPGFIVNRIQAAYNREITYLLDQGVATAQELDMAAKAGFGFRLACLGPLEIHDLNGLDVVMKAGAKTRQSICNDRGHSPSLLEKVEKGELGVKTGKGWHDYHGRSREDVINETNQKLLRQLALFQQLQTRPKP